MCGKTRDFENSAEIAIRGKAWDSEYFLDSVSLLDSENFLKDI
jgi:hypothetical protein